MLRQLIMQALWPLAAIAGAIDARSQAPLHDATANVWEQLSATADKPSILNVTLMHEQSGAMLSYNRGRVTAWKNTTHPTVWTLEKIPDARDGWYVYVYHPNGNKLYWSNTYDDAGITIQNSQSSAQKVNWRYAETYARGPALAVYWDDKCFNVQDELARMDLSACEGFKVEPAKLIHWNSTDIIKESSQINLESDLGPNQCHTYHDCSFCGLYERCCRAGMDLNGPDGYCQCGNPYGDCE